MPETKCQPHHPVLYFLCDSATMPLDDCANIFELQAIARMFVCCKNGKAHYLVIMPYSETDKTEERFGEWRRKMTRLLSDHCIPVRDITQEDAKTINALLEMHPESFGYLCLKLTPDERQKLLLPAEIVSTMTNESHAGGPER